MFVVIVNYQHPEPPTAHARMRFAQQVTSQIVQITRLSIDSIMVIFYPIGVNQDPRVKIIDHDRGDMINNRVKEVVIGQAAETLQIEIVDQLLTSSGFMWRGGKECY